MQRDISREALAADACITPAKAVRHIAAGKPVAVRRLRRLLNRVTALGALLVSGRIGRRQVGVHRSAAMASIGYDEGIECGAQSWSIVADGLGGSADAGGRERARRAPSLQAGGGHSVDASWPAGAVRFSQS